MKTEIISISIFLLVLLSSCFDDLYYYFSDDERSLLVYDMGDAFVLLRIPQQDTLTFIVTDIIRDSLRKSGLGLQYHNFEVYEAAFEQDNYFSGSIFAYKELTFEMGITLSVDNRKEFEGPLCDTLYSYNLNGQNYPELFVFASRKGESPMLYFSKDKGIVYIDSTASGNSYSLIEYVKK
jgi:hypothetical protein